MAGKRAKCKCGASIQIPAGPKKKKKQAASAAPRRKKPKPKPQSDPWDDDSFADDGFGDDFDQGEDYEDELDGDFEDEFATASSPRKRKSRSGSRGSRRKGLTTKRPKRRKKRRASSSQANALILLGVLFAVPVIIGAVASAATREPLFFFLSAFVAVALINIVAIWRVFEKAGQPGWMSIIPIANLLTLHEIGFFAHFSGCCLI